MALYEAYVAGQVFAALATVGVSYWVWQRDDSPAGRWFVVSALSVTAMSTGVLLQLAVADPWLKRLVFQLRYAPGWIVGPAWFVFAAYYTGREELLGRGTWALVVGGFGAMAALTLTNHLHGQMWTYTVATEPFYRIAPVRRWLYWAAMVGTYMFVIPALGLLVQYAFVTRRISRRQVTLLVVCSLPGTVMATAGPLGLFGLPVDLHYTSIAIGVDAVVAAWALYATGLFLHEPLARDTIVRFVDDAMLAVDTGGRVVDYNEAAADLFPGISAAIGSHLEETLPDLVGNPDADGPGQFADELTVYDGDDRRVFTVQASALEAGDAVRGYALALREVTEQRAYARRLERQTEQLDEFASTVSHDLRNPLTVARGYLDVVRENGDEAAIDEVESSLDRMERLIDDALTLARQGQAIEGRELVALGDVARAAWSTSDTAGATLTVEVPDEVSVYADPDRLQRALENLFRNCAEHGSAGGRPDAADGPQVVSVTVGLTDGGFYVADDGPGIPADLREEVFEQGMTTTEEGTGLGLAIVESIVDAHGWSIRATESADGGARFETTGVDLETETERTLPDTGPPA